MKIIHVKPNDTISLEGNNYKITDTANMTVPNKALQFDEVGNEITMYVEIDEV